MQMHNCKACILFLFFILSSIFSFSVTAEFPFGNSSDNVVVYDLSEDWLYYNKHYKSFFPYSKENKEHQNSISRLVDLNKYKLYNLNFTASPNLSLFVDQKLIYTNNSTEFREVKIRITEILEDANIEEELITFYHPQGKLPLDNFYVGYKANLNAAVNSENVLIIPRKNETKQNTFLVTFVIIMFFFAIIKNRYPKRFQEAIGFDNIIPSLEDEVVRDITSAPLLIIVFINSLCTSLLLFIIQENYNLRVLNILEYFNSGIEMGVLVISIGFFLILLIKYVHLRILGWIFNLSDFVKIQFFELMKVSLKINLFLTTIAVVFYCSEYFNMQLPSHYFVYFVIATIMLVIMRVGYLSFKLSGFRNIYLFSYLCTTEILPLAIIIKMILF